MKHDQGNKALCVLNFSGRYGGAEKRYLTLFRSLMNSDKDYYLIVNTKLYRLFLNNGILQPHDRIILFSDGGDGIPKEKKGGKELPTRNRDRCRSIKQFLGGWKYFLKTLVLWLRFSWFFIRQIRRNRISRIYGVWQGGIWTWMLCRLLNVELFYSVNATGKLLVKKTIRKFFDSQYYVLRHAQLLDFLSPSLPDEYFQALGEKHFRGQLVVTPNSFIDYTRYYSAPQKQPWVVFLGRLEPVKNPMLFLKAVKIFQDKYPKVQARFFVMGTGAMLSEMQQYVEKYQLRDVEFTGLHQRPWDVLQKSSVFASLQKGENYPSQSLIEAMACENGIVATDVGNTRRLVTEKDGFLITETPEIIADVFYTLLSKPTIRKEFGTNARKKVMAEHTLERFVEWFDALMERPNH
ncbi:glycosyltransferase [Marinilabilia rubra]|uniref:Glycosyl transferase family 1 n=1 Tax=Marinilabilia rubra TaxID=2162893 RepID=A0A2U2BB85_9BACT|nr:glycosyltransferase [Marinilabilia rubra]PWE00334.1 glycosyl transferase family 1 [Marinilabilia rubra]